MPNKQFKYDRTTNRIQPGNVSEEVYELLPGKVYSLYFDYRYEESFLKQDANIELPTKLYLTTSDKRFFKRVLTAFERAENQTTGILLSGRRGTGKTMMSKIIALETGLPIIIVPPSYPESKLQEFAKLFTQPCVYIIDEIEKNFETKKLLGFLDGVEAVGKQLVICTCNETGQLDSNLFNRPSRIRYHRTFGDTPPELVEELLADMDLNEKDRNIIYDTIIERFKNVSIDNILAFVNEYKLFSDEDGVDEILEFLNIDTIKDRYATGPTFEFDNEDDENDDICDDDDTHNSYNSLE